MTSGRGLALALEPLASRDCPLIASPNHLLIGRIFDRLPPPTWAMNTSLSVAGRNKKSEEPKEFCFW